MPSTPSLALRLRRFVVTAVAWGAVAIDFHGEAHEYFTYFTILTNLGISLWFLGAAWAPQRFERATVLRLSLTVYAIVTVVVFWTLLAHNYHPQGWNFVANLLLHLFLPAAMTIEGLLVPGPATKLSAPWLALIFPVVYCVAVIIRGEMTGWYPYFFLDKAEIGGWPFVAAYVLALLVVFVVISYLWRLLVNWRGKTTAT